MQIKEEKQRLVECAQHLAGFKPMTSRSWWVCSTAALQPLPRTKLTLNIIIKSVNQNIDFNDKLQAFAIVLGFNRESSGINGQKLPKVWSMPHRNHGSVICPENVALSWLDLEGGWLVESQTNRTLTYRKQNDSICVLVKSCQADRIIRLQNKSISFWVLLSRKTDLFAHKSSFWTL